MPPNTMAARLKKMPRIAMVVQRTTTSCNAVTVQHTTMPHIAEVARQKTATPIAKVARQMKSQLIPVAVRPKTTPPIAMAAYFSHAGSSLHTTTTKITDNA